jgi:hypothetical protein
VQKHRRHQAVSLREKHASDMHLCGVGTAKTAMIGADRD